MEEIITLIDKIIEEHKTILREFQTLEEISNDADVLVSLDKAQEGYMPGRFDKEQGLVGFEKILKKTEEGIQAHFAREEGALLNAFEKHGQRKIASALNALIVEHKNLTGRLVHSRQDVDKLKSGRLDRQAREAAGYDLRAYINYTRRLFETHAQMEQELLHTLRSELTGTKEA